MPRVIDVECEPVKAVTKPQEPAQAKFVGMGPERRPPIDWIDLWRELSGGPLNPMFLLWLSIPAIPTTYAALHMPLPWWAFFGLAPLLMVLGFTACLVVAFLIRR